MISNNFGRRKNDPAKDRKALETYVSLRGYKQGGNGSNQYKQKDHNGLFAKATLDEIAKELNMSTTNLKRVLRIERNLTDSMKELLDTGEITKTFASPGSIQISPCMRFPFCQNTSMHPASIIIPYRAFYPGWHIHKPSASQTKPCLSFRQNPMPKPL